MVKNQINGEAALNTLRRMIDERFYDDSYILNWIDDVLAGKQSPHQSMTPEVKSKLDSMRVYKELLKEGVHEDNFEEIYGKRNDA